MILLKQSLLQICFTVENLTGLDDLKSEEVGHDVKMHTVLRNLIKSNDNCNGKF